MPQQRGEAPIGIWKLVFSGPRASLQEQAEAAANAELMLSLLPPEQQAAIRRRSERPGGIGESLAGWFGLTDVSLPVYQAQAAAAREQFARNMLRGAMLGANTQSAGPSPTEAIFGAVQAMGAPSYRYPPYTDYRNIMLQGLWTGQNAAQADLASQAAPIARQASSEMERYLSGAQGIEQGPAGYLPALAADIIDRSYTAPGAEGLTDRQLFNARRAAEQRRLDMVKWMRMGMSPREAMSMSQQMNQYLWPGARLDLAEPGRTGELLASMGALQQAYSPVAAAHYGALGQLGTARAQERAAMLQSLMAGRLGGMQLLGQLAAPAAAAYAGLPQQQLERARLAANIGLAAAAMENQRRQIDNMNRLALAQAALNAKQQ